MRCDQTVVFAEVLSGGCPFAFDAAYFSFLARGLDVAQMFSLAFVNIAVITVQNTGSPLNKADFPMFQGIIEGINNDAVVFFTFDF